MSERNIYQRHVPPIARIIPVTTLLMGGRGKAPSYSVLDICNTSFFCAFSVIVHDERYLEQVASLYSDDGVGVVAPDIRKCGELKNLTEKRRL
ncbi:hypothetical protein ACN08Z_00205 [Rothia sp. P7181]|uniref:hypothetical protein n=1 Tax=unclassified Rothia (in: high G+C Gram-positive bacteria) TaxID=2689056 RepID=UPI003AC911B9